MSGRLYGVGLGPGDPELMTLKAHRLIQAAEVIAYPAPETDGVTGESFARSIAAGSIRPGTQEIAIPVPMRPERAPAQAAYDRGAEALAGPLSAGRDVVALCEGDPFFYGSFMYLFTRLADRFDAEIVPGVTSLTACAAAARRPLVARNEALTAIPAPLSDAEIEARLALSDAAAILKVGRHLPRLRRLLGRLGLTDDATYVSHASLAEQTVLPLAEAPESAPYFSMILLSRGENG